MLGLIDNALMRLARVLAMAAKLVNMLIASTTTLPLLLAPAAFWEAECRHTPVWKFSCPSRNPLSGMTLPEPSWSAWGFSAGEWTLPAPPR